MYSSSTSRVPMLNKRVRNPETNYDEYQQEKRSKDRESNSQQYKRTRKDLSTIKQKS